MFEAIKGRGPGNWWPCAEGEGRESATLYCYKCGKPSCVQETAISPSGVINDAICPHCGYCEGVKLVAWKEDRAAPPNVQPKGTETEPHVGETRFEGWLSEHAITDVVGAKLPMYHKQDMREAYWAGYCERGAVPSPAPAPEPGTAYAWLGDKLRGLGHTDLAESADWAHREMAFLRRELVRERARRVSAPAPEALAALAHLKGEIKKLDALLSAGNDSEALAGIRALAVAAGLPDRFIAPQAPAVDEVSINEVMAATNYDSSCCNSYWPVLFAKALAAKWGLQVAASQPPVQGSQS